MIEAGIPRLRGREVAHTGVGRSACFVSTRGLALILLTFAGLISVSSVSARAEPKYAGDCTSSGCHGPLVQRKFVHAPASDACDACHQTADEEAHKFELTEKGAALCFDCHDRFEGKHVHEPLADGGDCTTCHDPHASQSKALLIETTIEALCATCHDDLIEGKKFVHGPVAAGDCTMCHNPHASAHEALLRAEGPALCVECHEDIKEGIAEAAHVHEPVKDACVLCHEPHGASNKSMLTNEMPALCADMPRALSKMSRSGTSATYRIRR